MRRVCLIAFAVFLIAPSAAWGHCIGHETDECLTPSVSEPEHAGQWEGLFPGDFGALRPPRVRPSEPGESAENRVAVRSLPLAEAPREAAGEALTDGGGLTYVAPLSLGAYFTDFSRVHAVGGVTIDGQLVTLDELVFRREVYSTGDAIAARSERTVYLGQLPAGDYQLRVRTFHLPIDEMDASRLDLESVPPLSEVAPAPEPVLDGFQLLSVPAVPERYFTESTLSFTVLPIPEPSTLALALLIAGTAVRRRR